MDSAVKETTKLIITPVGLDIELPSFIDDIMGGTCDWDGKRDISKMLDKTNKAVRQMEPTIETSKAER